MQCHHQSLAVVIQALIIALAIVDCHSHRVTDVYRMLSKYMHTATSPYLVLLNIVTQLPRLNTAFHSVEMYMFGWSSASFAELIPRLMSQSACCMWKYYME